MKIADITHPLYFSINPQGETVTPRAHGIDISKYDLFFEPALATGQLNFVVQRISYRTTRDEAFDKLLPGVMSMGIRGGYHYLNSDTPWQKQADAFLSFVAGHDYHFFVCDFEDSFNTMSTAFAYEAWQWIQYVKNKTGKKVLLYAGPYVYKDYIVPSQVRYGIDWNTVDLWTAQWFFIPNPNGTPWMPPGRTAGWKLWQYTDKGDGRIYGVARATACDLDVFNGSPQEMRAWLGIDGSTPPPDPAPADEITHPFAGVTQVHGERYKRRIYVNLIDPKTVTIEVINEDNLPSTNCRKYGAQIAWNGDDWDRITRTVKDNPSPSLMVFPDGHISAGNHVTTPGEYHHTSGLRYLVLNGENTIPANGTEPKYTERHARSIIGVSRNGELVHLTVDGEYPDQGVTLYESAQLMIEFGAVTAFDQGGGGDSVEVLNGNVVNIPDDDAGGTHYERKVPQTILVYSKENNMPTAGTAKEKLGKTVTVRSSPRVINGNSTSEVVAPRATVSFVRVVDDLDYPGDPAYKWFELGPGRFCNYIYPPNGLRFDIITQPTDPDPEPGPEPTSKTITVIVKEDGYQDASVTVTQNPL